MLNKKANSSFIRMNQINLMNCQSRLKKDFLIRIKDIPNLNYHSFVFKKYLQGHQRKMNSLEKIKHFKNSEFFYEFNLRKGLSLFETANLSFKKSDTKMTDVEKLNQLLS